MFGILRLSSVSLFQGDSFKNLYATSNVAPPHISNEKKSLPYKAVAFAAFIISIVLTLVAIND